MPASWDVVSETTLLSGAPGRTSMRLFSLPLYERPVIYGAPQQSLIRWQSGVDDQRSDEDRRSDQMRGNGWHEKLGQRNRWIENLAAGRRSPRNHRFQEPRGRAGRKHTSRG